jgi:hypothetical protein
MDTCFSFLYRSSTYPRKVGNPYSLGFTITRAENCPAIAPDTSVIMTKVIAFKIIFSTWREKSYLYHSANDMENQPHASYHDKIHVSTLCQMPALLEQY